MSTTPSGEGRYTHIVKRESGYVAGWFQGEPPADFVAECNANVPGDPAHIEALDWAAWDRWCDQLEPHPVAVPATIEGHTCEQGPLCEQMTRYLDLMSGYDADPMSRAYGHYPEPPADVTDCEHWTCRGIVYGPCEQCQRDAMADYYRNAEAGR
jgi:hypothetical protein